jgi:heme exporter protein D
MSLLAWAGALVLGAFGIFFSFANYPVFATVVALAILLLVGYSERNRRRKQAETARRRERTRAASS